MKRHKRRWKQSAESGALEDRDERAILDERVRRDLELRGVESGEAARIATCMVERLLERGPEGYEDLLVGVGLAQQARVDQQEQLIATQGELKQLERLMSGFATELSKLDEVLEVLAAYVRRMRMDTGESDDDDPILH